MPSQTAQSHSNKNNNSQTSAIDFDALLLRAPHIVNMDQFIEETDSHTALVFWLSEFTDKSQLSSTQHIIQSINNAITTIDHAVNDLLNEIIHHPKLQQLESSWRGLRYLVDQADDAKNVKIRMLDISWAEVVKDISRAIEFDQSQLFRKIYSEEYDTPGGEPYGVLLGDYEISHKPSPRHKHDDIATLEGLAEVAAAAFAPFIAAASSELFGLDSFTKLGSPLNLNAIFNHQEYIKWRSLRDRADSRFIGLTLPRMIMRQPYRTEPGSFKGLFFYEKSSGSQNSSNLWGNACYAFGGVLLREFNNVGWFGHIRGVPRNQVGGGLITNLETNYFNSDPANVIHKPLAEVVVTDTLERHISDLGFIPLCQCYDVPFAAFYSNQSIHKPPRHTSKEANVNAKLSSMMQHILCASRMAHYIKVIIRDKVGSFMSAEDCERYLSRWLGEYISGREDMDWEEQARYPLRDADVKVREHPIKQGEYLCSIQLRPHYQLDQMVSQLELVTELTQKT